MGIVTLCLKAENGEEGGIAHGREDPLEKEGMANHFSFLSGESSGQGSLAGYKSIGSQRGGHN